MRENLPPHFTNEDLHARLEKVAKQTQLAIHVHQLAKKKKEKKISDHLHCSTVCSCICTCTCSVVQCEVLQHAVHAHVCVVIHVVCLQQYVRTSLCRTCWNFSLVVQATSHKNIQKHIQLSEAKIFHLRYKGLLCTCICSIVIWYVQQHVILMWCTTLTQVVFFVCGNGSVIVLQVWPIFVVVKGR